MDYLLFTYPNCNKCETFKAYLKNTTLQGREYNLAEKESKLRIREFLSRVKRDEKGGMILPILVLREDGQTPEVFNNHLELDNWLKSKA